MTSRCASVVAILVASFPGVVNAQVDCGAIPQGPARTDCYLGSRRDTNPATCAKTLTPLSDQSQKNTQIAAPQRATNQASESQTSTSSRLTNRRLARRANRKVPVLFLLSFIACSCFIIAPARAPKWRACRLALARGLAVILALLGTPTKPLNQQDEKASRWVNSHAACITQTFGAACEIMPNICY